MHNLQTAERELRDLKTSTANAGHLVEDKQVAVGWLICRADPR